MAEKRVKDVTAQELSDCRCVFQWARDCKRLPIRLRDGANARLMTVDYLADCDRPLSAYARTRVRKLDRFLASLLRYISKPPAPPKAKRPKRLLPAKLPLEQMVAAYVVLHSTLRTGELTRKLAAQVCDAMRSLRYLTLTSAGDEQPRLATKAAKDLDKLLLRLVARTYKHPPSELEYVGPYPILHRDTEESRCEPCPYCGLRHVHGHGDGHRSPHCPMHENGVKFLDCDAGYVVHTRSGVTA